MPDTLIPLTYLIEIIFAMELYIFTVILCVR